MIFSKTYCGLGSLVFSLISVISADIWASLGPRNVPSRLQKSPDIGDPPPSTGEGGGGEGGQCYHNMHCHTTQQIT